MGRGTGIRVRCDTRPGWGRAVTPLYTAIARCRTCKAELNRAEHVPENKRSQVTLSAPMMAFCEELGHNTLGDLNLNMTLEWVEESADAK